MPTTCVKVTLDLQGIINTFFAGFKANLSKLCIMKQESVDEIDTKFLLLNSVVDTF